MSTLHLDGFDHYATADITQAYTTSGTATITATNARNGTCLSLSNGGYINYALSTSWNTLFAGFALRTASLATAIDFISFYYSGTIQIHAVLNTNGTISIYRGTGTGTLLGTTSTALSINTWYYIEFGSSFVNSSIINFRINGVDALTLSAQNTNPAASGKANAIRLTSSTSTTVLFDDWYVNNYVGPSPNNSFLGDVRMEFDVPSSDGAYTAWTASAGARYAAIDDTTPDGATTYIYTSNPTDKDSANFGSLSGPTQQVLAASLWASAGTDAGTHTFKMFTQPSLATNATIYKSPAYTFGTSYSYFENVWDINPQTGAAWTVAEANAAQFGVEYVS